MRKGIFIILFMIIRIISAHGQAENTRIEDLTGMLGENYTNTLNEDLEAFQEATDVAVNLRIRYQNDYYRQSSDQFTAQWRQDKENWVDIVLETESGKIDYHHLKMEVNPRLDLLVPESERKEIINETMVPEFQTSLVTNNNYYKGLSNGIKELQEKIGHSLKNESSLNGTLAITHLDESFIPGDERLNIRYTIEDMEPAYAKMEVYALNEEGEAEDEPVFRDNSIVKSGTDVVYMEGGEEGWSGKISGQNYALNGKYLLKISISNKKKGDFKKKIDEYFEVEGHELVSVEEESITSAAEKAVEKGTDFVGNSTYAVCNICTRAGVYIITGEGDEVLFPEEGSFLGDATTEYLVGEITDPGYANNIARDLEIGKVYRFHFVSDMENEDYPDFEVLQEDANSGQIVIGTYEHPNAGESGHVVMIVPGETEKIDKFLLSDGFTNLALPQILECGANHRESKTRIDDNIGESTLKNMNWYKLIQE